MFVKKPHRLYRGEKQVIKRKIDSVKTEDGFKNNLMIIIVLEKNTKHKMVKI